MPFNKSKIFILLLSLNKVTYNVFVLKTFLNRTPEEYLLAALAPVKECALAVFLSQSELERIVIRSFGRYTLI
jgi:hypothetical protein